MWKRRLPLTSIQHSCIHTFSLFLSLISLSLSHNVFNFVSPLNTRKKCTESQLTVFRTLSGVQDELKPLLLPTRLPSLINLEARSAGTGRDIIPNNPSTSKVQLGVEQTILQTIPSLLANIPRGLFFRYRE